MASKTKWLIAAVLALIILVAVILYTEAYLDMKRNAIALLLGFMFITLCIRMLVSVTVSVILGVKELPKVEGVYKQQTSAPVDNTPKCPRCASTSISADKKGFGIGKAVVGSALAGPIGLTAGNIGAKKVRVTCLNCGHHWTAGKN